MGSEIVVGMEILLGQERWVRRLASALVRDEDESDDVVQEARVQSWRRPPRDPLQARWWLGQVVRNLVRNRARAEGIRRRVQGELAPADDAVPSAERLAERLEIHRELALAVSGLSEPFRQVVVLRYYDDLSAAEIARRLGEPAGTIRWRLKTGLDRLRVALDGRRGGERAAWVVALAPLTKPEGHSSRWSSSSAGRAALVGTAAFGVLVAAAITGMRSGRDRTPGVAGERASLSGPSAHGPGRPPGASPVALLAANRTDRGTTADEIPAWIQLEGVPRRAIAGRIVSGGRPVAGAQVRLSSATLPSLRRFDRHAVARADGTFAFPALPITDWMLIAWAPGLEPVIQYFDLRQSSAGSMLLGHRLDALVIDLAACRVFARGKVKEAGGGAISGARIRVGASWDGGGTEARTDGAGQYQLCVPTGSAYARVLTAEASGYGAVEGRTPSTTSTIDFVLEPQSVVGGRTLRKDSGEPVAGVDLVLDTQSPPTGESPEERRRAARREARSDEAGRFELTGIAPGRYTLRFASDDVYGALELPRTIGPADEIKGLDVRLSPVAVVDGEISRAGISAPNTDVRFSPVANTGGPGPRRTRSDEHGRFRVRLPQGMPMTIETPADPARPAERWIAALTPAAFVADRAHRDGVTIALPPTQGSAFESSEFVTPAGVAPPPPSHVVEGRFGEQVRLLGYDLAQAQVARGGALEVTLHFEVLAPLEGWRLLCHLVGPGGFTNVDHAPVRGAYPVARWRAGQTIRDRFSIKIPPTLAPGVYTLLTGFWAGRDRLAISPATSDDGEHRLRVLTFTVN
jgi:RNA polymerase sigma-70 factor (ECF subfamily)